MPFKAAVGLSNNIYCNPAHHHRRHRPPTAGLGIGDCEAKLRDMGAAVPADLLARPAADWSTSKGSNTCLSLYSEVNWGGGFLFLFSHFFLNTTTPHKRFFVWMIIIIFMSVY